MIAESASAEKDFYYHKVAGHFLAQGFPDLGITHTQVQDALTEISFVTKKNHDIEEQLADLLAYGLKIKYQYSGKKRPLDLYEQNILSVVNKKLFVAPTGTSLKKQKYYSKIRGFTTLP